VASEDWAGEYPAFAGMAFSGVITSYLRRRNFWKAIGEARQSALAVVAEAAAQAGVARTGPAVVIYGGLPGLVPAGPDDVACLHVEEFAEMLADAGGDRDMVAQFLCEVSLHPGLSGVLYVDVLDVWWHWRDHKMIGPLFRKAPGSRSSHMTASPTGYVLLGWSRSRRSWRASASRSARAGRQSG